MTNRVVARRGIVRGSLGPRAILGAGLASFLLLPGVSLGAIIGSSWVEVDNRFLPGTSTATGLNDGTLNGTRYRTFDLYITSDTPLTVLDSGVTQSSGPNAGLSVNQGSFFQRSKSGGTANNFKPDSGSLATDPIINFDTYFGLGTRLTSGVLITHALTFTSNAATGTWAATPGTSESPDAQGRIFAGRFTVETTSGLGTDESPTRNLSGSLFVFAKGATSGQVIQIANAYRVPTPASGVFTLVGLVALSRRRR
jgi:hypothetical protein